LSSDRPYRQIRGLQLGDTIRVYQAYSHSIADAAVLAQTLVAPFRLGRMTWIKPSFLWMMYRSNWGTRNGQERVLAIDITTSGLLWALEHSCLSRFDGSTDESTASWEAKLKESCVRIQWDPERDSKLERLPYRSIQIGLTSEAVERYVNEWIKRIEDQTDAVEKIRHASSEDRSRLIEAIVERELPFELEPSVARRIGAS
jgi:pre-mRNA-splicing factor ATP-dependent RNA helicase DHX16